MASCRRLRWADELRQAHEQREVGAGNVEELLPEVVQCPVGKTLQIGGGLSGEQCDVSARELLF
jgi:hypothetical protein